MKWEPQIKKAVTYKIKQDEYEKVLDEIAELLYDYFCQQEETTSSTEVC